jgi:hypothetical protein
MNYQKLDATLVMALKDVLEPESPNLVVFIHIQTPLEADAIAQLEALGISNIAENKDVFTATVSPNAVSKLSDQTWVKYLKLSRKLRLANQI